MSSAQAPGPVEISFRKATLQDADCIRTTWPSLYNGLDYLQFYLERFLTDARREGFVAVCRGEVVGFAMGFVVDKETRCVIHSARVKESLQGLGVYKSLSLHLRKEVAKKYPTVTQVTFTSSSQNAALKRPSFWHVHQEALRRHYFVHTVSSRDLEATLPSMLHLIQPGIEPVTETMLGQLMSSTDDQLFPGNRLTRNWETFELMEDNAELIMRDASAVVWSKKEGRVTCVSLNMDFVVPAGPRLELDIYGVEMDAIVSHIVFFMQRFLGQLTESDTRDRHVLLSVDSRVDTASIGNVLSQLGLQDGIYPHYDHFSIVAPIDAESD